MPRPPLNARQIAQRARHEKERLIAMYSARLDRHANAMGTFKHKGKMYEWHRFRAEQAREELRKVDH